MKYNYLFRQAQVWSLVLFLLAGFGLSSLQAQCAFNNVPFGSDAAPTVLNDPDILTTCIYGGEYREVTNLQAGSTYRFETCGDSDFDTQITIFDASGSTSLAYNDDFCGFQSSVDFTPSSSGIYLVQINEYNCATNFTCMTLTATLVGSSSTCNDNEVVVELFDSFGDGWNGNVLDISDETGNVVASATLEDGFFGSETFCLPDGCYTVDVGGGSYYSEVGWEIFVNSNLALSGGAPEFGLELAINSTCNTPPPPTAGCNPGEAELNETYCYGNNDNTTFSYESADGSSPMTLTFSAGGIESCCDDIIIYDGPDASSPVLFFGSNGGDLSGVSVTSTGTQLFMVVESDLSVSCGSESSCCATPWQWTVCNGSAGTPPPNDFCTAATPIECGEAVTGNTTLATDNNPSACGFAGDGNSGGVWYTITGTGGEITASACGSSFDTQLAVYEGSCSTLSCVDGNDDACSLQSEVSWNSTPGTVYYIYLDGFGTNTGAYTLSVSCVDPCDIAITGSSSTPETCPGDNDGSLTVSASCTSCSGIEYSIGGAFQSSSTFTGLSAGSYTVTAQDASDPSCSASTTVSVGAGTGGAVLPPWSATDIGQTTGNSYSQNPCAGNGVFTINSGANNGNPMSDGLAFIGQTICGNGEISAKLESVDALGYGGLVIRESASPGAKQYALYSNLTNILRTEVRTMTNGMKTIQNAYRPYPIWLKMVRSGNAIFSYWSTNGSSYQLLGYVFLSMDNCVQMGMAAFTTANGPKTAVFSNVSISGTVPSLETPENWTADAAVHAEKATLFPNPAQDLVTVEFGSTAEVETQLVLRNQIGQQVRQLFVEPGAFRRELNVSDLTSGMYLIELRREGQPVEVLRFIKQ